MSIVHILIPVTLIMGLVGLAAFLWSLRNGQYDDLKGAAERVLLDEAPPAKAIRNTRSARRDDRAGGT